jgi:hypothetical protein
MKTLNPDIFINKFYFVVILVFLTIFLVSNMKGNETFAKDNQNQEIKASEDLTLQLVNN